MPQSTNTYSPPVQRRHSDGGLYLRVRPRVGMERLTANRRPFRYVPLRHHFEQNLHVRHRLNRYRAGRCMDYETATAETIAAAIAEEIGREVDYLPVEPNGARTAAAAAIAELL